MSDSHGHFNQVRKIVEANKELTDCFIHLGDGLEEFQDVSNMYHHLCFVAVKGNNDWGSIDQKLKVQTWGSKLVMMTHGDLEGVKYNLDGLVKKAAELKVDVVLYGHTHVARCDYINGVHIINPGSLKESYRTPSSYLSLEISANSITPTIILVGEEKNNRNPYI